MSKYVIEVLDGQQLTAGSKAKLDIVKFLLDEKFEKITFQSPKKRISKLLFGRSYWKKTMKGVKNNSTIVFQYPAYSRIMGDYFIKESKKKNIYKIIVIHDLDSLRIYRDRPKDIKREINFCNEFDVVICHNEKMKKWLIDSGCTANLISLEIFDYYETNRINDMDSSKAIIFAGNLSKSDFISKLECETPINLYGINPKSNYPQNISYKGAYKTEELSEYMEGKYGLVWDGDSTDTCTGMTGEYMRYNNPHKTSLYLSLGIPVVIWKEAALSRFIKENELGLVLENLNNLDYELAKITDEQYDKYKKNSIEISKKIRSGWYIKNAIMKTK